jgi:two-component system LytT family response regulator
MVHNKWYYFVLDDEQLNVELIQTLMQKEFSHIQCIGVENNPAQAIHKIETLRPNILFLDVEMPELSGFDVLTKIDLMKTAVIMITAHSQYAVEAIENRVSAFVVKPIQKLKFIEAVNRVIESLDKDEFEMQFTDLVRNLSDLQYDSKIVLSNNKKIIFLDQSEILYCESNNNYTNFYLTNGKKELVSRPMGDYEKLLNQQLFARVHDSFIVNIKYIKEYLRQDNCFVLSSGATIPISIRRKSDFFSKFEKWLKKA